MVATQASASTHRYVPRLMAALGHPATIVPVHWDNFELPLADGPQRDPSVDLEGFAAQVRAASPGTRVLIPEYLTPYGF
jgi:hypothetical protein